MIVLPPVWELTIVAVQDPGVAGRERVAIRPTQHVQLGEFIFAIGYQLQVQEAAPFNNLTLWFGNKEVEPPSWVIIFTGNRPPEIPDAAFDYVDPNRKERILTFFLGQPNTLFDKPGVIPMLFRLGGVLLGPATVPPPHLAAAREAPKALTE